MKRRRARVATAWCLAIGLGALFDPTPAGAQSAPPKGTDRPPAEAAAAIDAGREAAALYGERHYQEAYERFALADRLTHSPVFVLYMARCARNLGHLLDARALFRRAAEEPLPDSAGEPMRGARDQARVELAQVEQRIPLVVVVVDPPGARVTVDDRLTAAGRIELDPGTHKIVAVWNGGRRAERVATLVEGGAAQRLELSAPAASGDGAASRTQGPLWPGLLTLGTGALFVVVGAVSGAVALKKTSDLRDECGGVQCAPSQRPEGDAVHSAANLSTVTFLIGGALSVVGIGLLVVRPFGRAPAPGAASPGATRWRSPLVF